MNQPHNQGMGLRSWIALIAGAYAVSPIDLVPDVPIIGWGDDAVVIIVALALLAVITVVQKLPTSKGSQ